MDVPAFIKDFVENVVSILHLTSTGAYAWRINSLPIGNGTRSPYLLTLVYRYVSATVPLSSLLVLHAYGHWSTTARLEISADLSRCKFEQTLPPSTILFFFVNICAKKYISFKRTLSPSFRNLPLLHITIRLHLTSRLLKFMQWLARKQYVLRSW